MTRIDGVRIVLSCYLLCCSCNTKEDKRIAPKARKATTSLLKKTIKTDDPKRLSDYAFFTGELKDLTPAKRVYPYAINTPLFSNYAKKARFIYLPEGKTINFKDNGPFEVEEGTILIKNFFYHEDEQKENSPKKS